MQIWSTPGTYLMPVAGCTHYREAISAIARNGTDRALVACQAELIPEPNNEHDQRAVRVDIMGQKVGYLPSDRLDEYLALFASVNTSICPMACKAVIVNGGTVVDGGQSRLYEYTIELDVPKPGEGYQCRRFTKDIVVTPLDQMPKLFWANDDHCLLIARLNLTTRLDHGYKGKLCSQAQWEHINLYLENGVGIGAGNFVASIPKATIARKFGGALPEVELTLLDKTTACFELKKT